MSNQMNIAVGTICMLSILVAPGTTILCYIAYIAMILAYFDEFEKDSQLVTLT